MKPTLQLQIGQKLKMTPQLQQAIRLLQLSTLDLRMEIQQAVETNPLLELDEHTSTLEQHDTDQSVDAELDMGRSNALEELAEARIDTDSEWDDLYIGHSSISAGSSIDADAWQERTTAPTTLHNHLQWQLDLTPMSDRDRLVAGLILEALDERGYLTVSLDELQETADSMVIPADHEPLEEDEIRAVLRRLQQFDPLGVASRNLTECLSIQLNQLPADTPHLDLAHALLHHAPLIARHDYRALRRALSVSDESLAAALALLRTLDPEPGRRIGESSVDHVVPDVIVRASQQGLRVELNEEVLPRVNLHGMYTRLARQSSGDTGRYLRNCMQEARWFLKSLQSRNETVLKVARHIVEIQQDFFHYGEEAMRPLILADIAEAVDMHESTISRVTNQKFMLTPRGVFELKHFFSSHVSTDSGGECSSTAIRAMIRKLVAAEDPRKPLSDNKLANLLKEQGINVARRTVAKYREAMRLPPSSMRKRLVEGG